MLEPISMRELRSELARAPPHTAPGDDGIPVDLLKRVSVLFGSESCFLGGLLVLYNTCFRLGHTPQAWRTAAAVLLQKPSGDPTSIRTWRHICLIGAAAKLYAAILGTRLTNFMTVPGRLSRGQVGFMPAVSSEFHALALRVALADARRSRRDLAIIFIDVRNAFGSISHDAIQRALSLYSVPAHFREIVRDLYTGVGFYFRGVDPPDPDYDPVIPLERGVRQGCPLSPILYAVAFDPVLRWLERSGLGYSFASEPGLRLAQLGFADDVALVAESLEAAPRSTEALCRFGRYAGTGLNPTKCGVLVLRAGVEAPDHPLHTPDGVIPGLPRGGGYRYLGFELRADPESADAETWRQAVAKFHERLAAIDKSALPPLARLETLRCWAQPVLAHVLKLAVVPVTELARLDAETHEHAAKWLSNSDRPGRRSNPLPGIPRLNTFEPRAFGGLGVQSVETTNLAAKLSVIARALCRPTEGAISQWEQFHRIVCRGMADEPLLAPMFAPVEAHQPNHHPSLEPFWSWLLETQNQRRFLLRPAASGTWGLEFRDCHAGQILPAKRAPPKGDERRRRWNFLRLVDEMAVLPRDTTVLFTDGSLLPPEGSRRPTGGAAAVLCFPDGRVLFSSEHVHNPDSSGFPELRAMKLGLEMLHALGVPPGRNIALLSDSQYALMATAGVAQVARYHALVYEVQAALRTWTRLSLHYAPSHMGRVGGAIWGNDVADVLAGQAALALSSTGAEDNQSRPLVVQATTAIALLDRDGGTLTPPMNGQADAPLPWCRKELTHRLLHALAHGWTAGDRARLWLRLKCLWVSSHSLDPLEARLSSTHWRQDAAPLWRVRRWLYARFGAFFGVNAVRFRMRWAGSPFCRAPGCRAMPETQAHLLGSCSRFREFYISRADRVVQQVTEFLRDDFANLPRLFITMGVAKTNRRPAFPPEVIALLPAEMQRLHPDVVVITDSHLELVEISVTTASCTRTLADAAERKRLQYAELLITLQAGAGGRRSCSLTVLLFGATGLIPRATFCDLARLRARLSGEAEADAAIDRSCAILQSAVAVRAGERVDGDISSLVKALQGVSRALVSAMMKLFAMRLGGERDWPQ